MGPAKWKFKRNSPGKFGIWCDDGTMGGRFLWMENPSEFQIHMARQICKELNRAGVVVALDKRGFLEVVSRKTSDSKRKGGTK